jgi:2-hydroxycyclohexanecarboxyl-CoA dehydrogenase
LSGGGSALAVAGDVTAGALVETIVGSVLDRLGPIDVLVNNAGLPASGVHRTPFVTTSRPDWEPYVTLNVFGVMECARAVLPAMLDRGWGRIITIASDAGRVGERGMAAYSASKAAAMGFTRALAREVGAAGVTCNCVSLGAIEPGGAAGELADDVRRDYERAASSNPMRRLGTPGDAAGAVLWLASPATGWVTGQTVSVNGGNVPS